MRSELVLSLHAFIWEKGFPFLFLSFFKSGNLLQFSQEIEHLRENESLDGKTILRSPSRFPFPLKRGTETKTNDFPPAARERRNNDLGGEKKGFF